MKNNIISFLFVLFNLLSYGQNEPYKLPEMAIPSPQAFEISKYGDTPIDESSGRISPSIPLHNYVVGNLSVPISLSYSGGGVKVSQNPTWTGISWNLNAGGVISRVVKDLPDETSLERIFYSKEELELLKTFYEIWSNTVAGDNPWYDFINEDSEPYLIESGYRLPQDVVNSIKNFEYNDSQVDEFNFSFGSYSGSFYLIKESGVWKAKQMKHNSELKIEILGNFNLVDNYEFKITTPDGIMYYFGGLAGGLGSTLTPAYAFEETQLLDKSVTPYKSGIRSKTAFYLTKVENLVGDYIFFEYETIPQYEILSAREQKLFSLITSDINGPCSVGDGIQNNTNFLDRPIKNTVFNGKFLRRIWSPLKATSIMLNSSDVIETLQGGTQNFKYKVLTDIFLENKSVNFTFFPEESVLLNGNKDKFFLTEIIFKDSNNQNESEKYKFEYKNLSMAPGQFSNSQDYLGYYNGKSNPSLLPKNSSFLFSNYLNLFEAGNESSENLFNSILNLSNFSNYESILADRDPDFSYATIGILEKIIYPTKGYTVFEYEPVEKKVVKDGMSFLIYNNMGNASLVNPAWVPGSVLNLLNGISSTFITESGSPGQNVFVNQSVKVDVDINTVLASGLDYHDYIYVQFKDVVTNNIVEKKYFFPTSVMDNNSQTNFSTSFVFGLIKDHGYEISVGFGDNYAGKITTSNKSHFSSTPMSANISFSYIKGYDENDGLGIRIKRIKDFDNNNSTPQIKRFFYSNMKDITKGDINSAEKIYSPLFHNYHITTVECPPDIELNIENGGILNRYYLTLNSNSFNQNLPSTDSPTIYNNVSISYGGDNFENGGIEKTFFIKKDKNQIHYSTNPGQYVNIFFYFMIKFYELDVSNKTNEGALNGLILKEDIWKNKNGVLYKTQKNIYEYEQNETIGANNINIVKFSECNYCFEFSIANLFLGLYSTNTYKPLLINKKEISFIDEIPLSRYIPPVNGHAWQYGDHDADGILNGSDEDYLNYSESYIESNYKKIMSTINYDYFLPVMPELPTIITSTNSDGEVSIVRNFYPIAEDINALTAELSSNEILTYNILKNGNRISKPIQVNTSNSSQLLSKMRIVYQPLDNFSNAVFEHKIQSAKTGQDLEDRVIYHKYDGRGNPVELSLANGSKVVYIWSFQRKPLYKIINATYNEVTTALSGSGVFIDDSFTGGINNYLIDALPNAQITSYRYTPLTNLLSQVIDFNGKSIYYEYDEFDRLKFIKDEQGNILSENENHYKD